MDTFNNSPSRNPSSFAPVTAVDDDDQFEPCSSPPLSQDFVKAIVPIVLIATVLGLLTCISMWKRHAPQSETQSPSKTEKSIADPSECPESQTAQSPEKRYRRNRFQAAPQAERDDDVEPERAQQPLINVCDNVISFEVNLEQHLTAQVETNITDQRIEVQPETKVPYQRIEAQTETNVPYQRTEARTISYFDNAGRSYPTISARDWGEEQRLAESFADYPAMSTQQREILQRRAHARIEQLDMEQRMAFSP
jgi:cell division protein FtsN